MERETERGVGVERRNKRQKKNGGNSQDRRNGTQSKKSEDKVLSSVNENEDVILCGRGE